MTAALKLQEQLFVGPQEEREADQFLREAAEHGVTVGRHLTVVAPAQDESKRHPGASDGAGSERTVEMPAGLLRLLTRVIQTVAEGGTITLMQFPAELTTTVAAEMLGISRPTLMKWIREKKIPAHKVGAHTRLKTEDVQSFRRQMLREQSEAIDEMWDVSNQLGI